MATLQIVTPDELEARTTKSGKRLGRKRSAQRTTSIESFKTQLEGAEPGDGGDVLLTSDENKRIVRANLHAAADEMGFALDFRPIKKPNRMHFRVISLEEYAARPKRGGRPRKVQEQPPERIAEKPQRARRTRKAEAS